MEREPHHVKIRDALARWRAHFARMREHALARDAPSWEIRNVVAMLEEKDEIARYRLEDLRSVEDRRAVSRLVSDLEGTLEEIRALTDELAGLLRAASRAGVVRGMTARRPGATRAEEETMRETPNPSGPTGGTEAIHAWLEDLMASIDRGERVETAAGAQPRSYAYLAFSGPDDRHSVLLFSVEMGEGEPAIVARKIDGSGERVRSELEALKRPAYLDR